MLWFEALPSPRRADAARLQRDLDRLGPLADAGVDRIIVPEVLDGDHATVDNLGFAAQAAAATGLPACGAVCLPPRTRDALHERAAQARAADIDSLLLVGATHRGQSQAGPGVDEALAMLRGTHDLGVVTIPTRRRWRVDEPHRLLRKHRAGAAFSISQILFDAEEALSLRREYVRALAPGEQPIPVAYSLAPVQHARDQAFLHRLGVHVPHALARSLQDAGPHQRLRIARDAALQTAGRLARAHEEERLGPFGFCISHVMVGNVEAAVDLAATVRDDLVQTIVA